MKLTFATALASVALAATACGSSTITSAADGPADAPANSQAGASQEPAKQRVAGIGDAITLRGMDDGAKISIKLAKVITTGRAANDFAKPDAGKRLFAVEIIMKNTGKANYDDSPTNGATVVDTQGQQYEASLFGEIAGTHPIGSSVTFGPGDSRRGVITFEVPAKAKVAKFMFALDSGIADQKGEWSLH